MRIIFSRKGFDSSAGGCPSPLIDGQPLSLPIPTRMPSPVTFADLGEKIAAIVPTLTRRTIRADSPCHLDPDLKATALPRLPDWRGSLGQVGAAQSHLANQGVTINDVFVFWGLYQPTASKPQWHFTGPREHRVFGWLQIGEIWKVGADPQAVLKAHPWLGDHPHAHPGWGANNTIYVATHQLQIDGQALNYPGWGLFPTGLRLTASDSDRPSIWQVPAWLHPAEGGVGMSYHPAKRWQKNGRLDAAARGQEFVANIQDRADAREWLVNLTGGSI